MSGKTIERCCVLQVISNEHHFVLDFCRRIRTGFVQSVAPDRIVPYVNWFYQNKFVPHINVEEEYLFPVLGEKNEFIKRAISEHRKLRRLFENNTDRLKSISLIEEELEKHIRFEEKVLYNKIQDAISEKDFILLNSFPKRNQLFEEEWKDAFWNLPS